MDIGNLLDYFGHILKIMKINFKKFETFIFDVEWFKVMVCGRNATVHKDQSKLIQVHSRKIWQDQQDTFLLQKNCEKILFFNKPKWMDANKKYIEKPRWQFTVQIAP